MLVQELMQLLHQWLERFPPTNQKGLEFEEEEEEEEEEDDVKLVFVGSLEWKSVDCQLPCVDLLLTYVREDQSINGLADLLVPWIIPLSTQLEDQLISDANWLIYYYGESNEGGRNSSFADQSGCDQVQCVFVLEDQDEDYQDQVAYFDVGVVIYVCVQLDVAGQVILLVVLSYDYAFVLGQYTLLLAAVLGVNYLGTQFDVICASLVSLPLPLQLNLTESFTSNPLILSLFNILSLIDWIYYCCYYYCGCIILDLVRRAVQ
ncbi:MAG: hypothetical protein EZS28_000590 [Streblomastix strix]|uniref:Uncharacterized protein n=1 Tax=Streblomastix strix TaxID=222440 RepID=A0A5J4X9U2_9EUKA|nr:MAG: hypothetical protein EZS28_000590 [Streblomastix strix]